MYYDHHGIEFKYEPTIDRHGDILERAYTAVYNGYILDIMDHGSEGCEWGFTVDCNDFYYNTEDNEGPYQDKFDSVVEIIKITLDAYDEE